MKAYAKRASLMGCVSFVRDRQAFSLVSVLLMTGFLSAVVLMIVLSTRSSLDAARVKQDALQARLAADAAINRVITALETADDPLQVREVATGRVERRMTFNNAIINILVQPEDGKLDINHAPIDHVEGLLRRIGFDETTVRYATTRLVEARRDNILLFKVSELLPEKARFSSSVAVLEAYFTTLTATNSFNPKLADPIILETIPGISTTEVDALFRYRQGDVAAGDEKLLQTYAGRFNLTASAYRIQTNAKLESGATARREAEIVLRKGIKSSAVLIKLETVILLPSD